MRLIVKDVLIKTVITYIFTGRRLFFLTLLLPLFSSGQVNIDTAFLMQQRVYHNLNDALANADSVYILDLSRKKLNSFPEQIYKLKNLRILDLSHNKIKEIPATIGNLNHLNGLDFSNNKIVKIPPEIGALSDLISLKLNRNIIDSLPPEIGRLKNLEELELWDNELHYIPDEIKSLYNLKVLELRGILFNEEEQQRIRSLLPDAVVYLSPSCNCRY